MYAYVKILEGSRKGSKVKIPVSKIKHDFSNVEDFDRFKKYFVQDKDGQYCKASIIFMDNSEEDLNVKIQERRIKMVPEAQLVTDSSDTDALVMRKSKSGVSLDNKSKKKDVKALAKLFLMKEEQLHSIISLKKADACDVEEGGQSTKYQKDTGNEEKTAVKCDNDKSIINNVNITDKSVEKNRLNNDSDGTTEIEGSGKITISRETSVQDGSVDIDATDDFINNHNKENEKKVNDENNIMMNEKETKVEKGYDIQSLQVGDDKNCSTEENKKKSNDEATAMNKKDESIEVCGSTITTILKGDSKHNIEKNKQKTITQEKVSNKVGMIEEVHDELTYLNI